MTGIDFQYLALLRQILNTGNDRTDRTGTGTRSLFGPQLRMNLQDGFPLLTTKKVNFKPIVGELLWFLKGSTNVKPLQEQGIHIWDDWADEDGELGPIYGKQWRSWPRLYLGDIDQIQGVVDSLGNDPFSRRHIVSAWNVAELSEMALAPCHCFFQFYVEEDQMATLGQYRHKLSCHMYQRSADVFLGVPFNIASYALLTHMMAQVCYLGVGDLVISFGDVHIYRNHFSQVVEQLSRNPRKLPTLELSPRCLEIDEFTMGDIQLKDYNPYPAIKAPIAV
jgi:thymidylate synthase